MQGAHHHAHALQLLVLGQRDSNKQGDEAIQSLGIHPTLQALNDATRFPCCPVHAAQAS
jgi:hypothetical protein